MNNGNESAMPTGDHREIQPEYGMSKREQFAAMAMQGMLTNGAQTEHGGKSLAPSTLAMYAVLQADELIKALNL